MSVESCRGRGESSPRSSLEPRILGGLGPPRGTRGRDVSRVLRPGLKHVRIMYVTVRIDVLTAKSMDWELEACIVGVGSLSA